jgi:hypothetical protein
MKERGREVGKGDGKREGERWGGGHTVQYTTVCGTNRLAIPLSIGERR